MDFLAELASGPLLADGAMGTLLMGRGVARDSCFEELCLSNPELIEGIHAEYLASGSRVIETHSFGANAARLARHGLENRVSEINWAAAQIARAAAKGKSAYVAGCVGPLYLPDLTAEEKKTMFQDQIGTLLDGGVDLIHLETFTDLEELELALYVKQSLHHCPVICSLVCDEEGNLGDGTPIGEAFRKLTGAGADVCGVNCISADHAVKALKGLGEYTLSALPNAGFPREEEGRLVYDETPQSFAGKMKELAATGVRVLGGCCGTTPAVIREIARVLGNG